MTASLEEKVPVVASATLVMEIISHEMTPKVEEKEDSGHWKPGRLGKSRHWQNTHVSCHRCERDATHARRSTASAARTEEEVHDVGGNELQLQRLTSTS